MGECVSLSLGYKKTCTLRKKAEMVLNISQALLFSVSFLFCFFLWPGGLNSCQRRVDIQTFDFLCDASWQNLDQNTHFVYPQLSYRAWFLLKCYASFIRASGIISKSGSESFVVPSRIIIIKKDTKFSLFLRNQLDRCFCYTAAIFCIHASKWGDPVNDEMLYVAVSLWADL